MVVQVYWKPFHMLLRLWPLLPLLLPCIASIPMTCKWMLGSLTYCLGGFFWLAKIHASLVFIEPSVIRSGDPVLLWEMHWCHVIYLFSGQDEKTKAPQSVYATCFWPGTFHPICSYFLKLLPDLLFFINVVRRTALNQSPTQALLKHGSCDHSPCSVIIDAGWRHSTVSADLSANFHQENPT